MTLAEIMADSGHYSIDRTAVRAYGSVAGFHRRALGRSRGGFNSKLHCSAGALEQPVAFQLKDGETADSKAHDAHAIRRNLAERKIATVIPDRSNRRVKIERNRTLYKQRNHIERMFGRLKINRTITTRYGQLVNNFLRVLHLATAKYWLNLPTPPSARLQLGL